MATAGYRGFFSLDDKDAAVQVLTGQTSGRNKVRDVTGNFPIDNHDVSALGTDVKRYLTGQEDGTIQLMVYVDADIINWFLQDRDEARSFVWGPAGNTSGSIELTGECFVQNLQITGSVDGAVTGTLSLQVSAGATVGTF